MRSRARLPLSSGYQERCRDASGCEKGRRPSPRRPETSRAAPATSAGRGPSLLPQRGNRVDAQCANGRSRAGENADDHSLPFRASSSAWPDDRLAAGCCTARPCRVGRVASASCCDGGEPLSVAHGSSVEGRYRNGSLHPSQGLCLMNRTRARLSTGYSTRRSLVVEVCTNFATPSHRRCSLLDSRSPT